MTEKDNLSTSNLNKFFEDLSVDFYYPEFTADEASQVAVEHIPFPIKNKIMHDISKAVEKGQDEAEIIYFNDIDVTVDEMIKKWLIHLGYYIHNFKDHCINKDEYGYTSILISWDFDKNN